MSSELWLVPADAAKEPDSQNLTYKGLQYRGRPRCTLCKSTLVTMNGFRAHLKTKKHITKEALWHHDARDPDPFRTVEICTEAPNIQTSGGEVEETRPLTQIWEQDQAQAVEKWVQSTSFQDYTREVDVWGFFDSDRPGVGPPDSDEDDDDLSEEDMSNSD
ncbi:hypothetical protein BDZ88DRAFT_437843 [Geranomyces variabilis]|nr:hypothetical protein BDZ88DRAFT_437843 [Geranomyces variabilis]KAJ3133071.1 hypothetical protein HDU90_006413 [Geranomyces variabilis]